MLATCSNNNIRHVILLSALAPRVLYYSASFVLFAFLHDCKGGGFMIIADNLLERSGVMAILSHVASLKQMGILHMVGS
jgi:predicted Ser/Thr protein kinase